MKFTIIIAVFNRMDEVRELLSSAEKLDFPRKDFELLFVDDGSTDEFKEFLANYTSESNLTIRSIWQKNKGPGAARNFGMQSSNTSYFVYVDSDCTFPAHWLKAIDTAIEKHKWDAFGGPDTFDTSFSPLLKAINYAMTSFIGTAGTRGNKKSVGRFYPRSFNMGIHRKVFEKIGGMGKLRHGQDMDYSQRIFNAGFTVGLIPDAYVYHKRRTSLFKFFKQIFNWGVARINLGIMHPALFKLIHFIPAILILFFILLILYSIIFKSFSLFIWIIFIIFYICINIWVLIESFIMYKNLKASLLSPIVLNMQIIAYGIGLLYASWQIKILGKKEAKGFVKNYYKS